MKALTIFSIFAFHTYKMYLYGKLYIKFTGQFAHSTK